MHIITTYKLLLTIKSDEIEIIIYRVHGINFGQSTFNLNDLNVSNRFTYCTEYLIKIHTKLLTRKIFTFMCYHVFQCKGQCLIHTL